VKGSALLFHKVRGGLNLLCSIVRGNKNSEKVEDNVGEKILYSRGALDDNSYSSDKGEGRRLKKELML